MIRHTNDAVSIKPAQKPRKMSFHRCGIFLTINPIVEPSSDASPRPPAHKSICSKIVIGKFGYVTTQTENALYPPL